MAIVTTTNTILMSSSDIIASALRLINALASGETPSSAEASDGLAILNQMLDVWNSEGLMKFAEKRIVTDSNNNPLNLVPGQQTYQLGPSAPDFNLPRPPNIMRAGIISYNNPAQPLELPLDFLTTTGWQLIPVKNIPSALPTAIWVDTDFPFMFLNYFPVPSVIVGTALYERVALQFFADLTTTFGFPPAYLEAIRYNLAERLAPEWGMALRAEVEARARETKGIVKSGNSPLVDLQCDAALVNPSKRVYNWLTDGPGPAR